MAREHPAVNNAVRGLRRRGIPVVCLTTDLPSSRRSAYVGNDQHAAGSVAAQLIGNARPRAQQNVLLVVSVAFRCQQEREMGFRRVLRSAFPHLRIVERVISDEVPETTREQLGSFLKPGACRQPYTTLRARTAASPRRWRSRRPPNPRCSSGTS